MEIVYNMTCTHKKLFENSKLYAYIVLIRDFFY